VATATTSKAVRTIGVQIIKAVFSHFQMVENKNCGRNLARKGFWGAASR